MSVVNRLSDWPRPTARRPQASETMPGGTRGTAEIIILPCIRRERCEERQDERREA